MSVEELQLRIQELAAEIERQKEVLNQLERSKKATQRQLNALRDPIARLPLEISSEIFLQCLRSELPRPDPSAAPMLLLNICNAWTNIALSTPALWAAISIERPCHELLRIWPQRARSYPLSVGIEGELESEIAVIGGFSKKLKHLAIDFDENPPLSSFTTLGPFPSLETLDIGSLAQREIYEVSITEMIDLLRLASNLVEFTLHNVATRVDYNEKAVILPNIRTVKFGAALLELASYDAFLRYISLPSLSTLFLPLRVISVDDFVLFWKRSSAPLQKLDLGEGCYELTFLELEPCFRLVPSLVHLELCFELECLADLITVLGSSPSEFLPNLQSLKIEDISI
ncbi:hypothetical protein C8F04DRAFT_1061935 [Mycena alexandri]|uniref:F-box domain-containing protein n=1 Tax=Mycena alexandri TaxID=1745969 RepID=A0AAD6TK84_9AGAR|nr:hypothetical protein C8F04DRAFT_1061935 [Mycena alexandri]